MPAEPTDSASIAQAIAEVSERATTIVREEIELAKAEISAKVMKIVIGAGVAVVGGMFLAVALLFALHGFNGSRPTSYFHTARSSGASSSSPAR